jgi:GxxExxY protein
MDAKQNVLTENDIARIIVDCALKVHWELGPGLLESSYKECLFYKLKKAGLFVVKEMSLPLFI